MVGEAGGRVGGDRERAGSNRDMRARHADQIDHQGNGEDRAAAADEAEPEAEAEAEAGDHQRGGNRQTSRKEKYIY